MKEEQVANNEVPKEGNEKGAAEEIAKRFVSPPSTTFASVNLSHTELF